MISSVQRINDRMEWLFRFLTTEGVELARRPAGEYTAHLYLLNNRFYEIFYHPNKHPAYVWDLESEYALHLYIDSELRGTGKNQEPNNIPLVCPFTGVAFTPGSIYFIPYPETVVLVCHNGKARWSYGPCKDLEAIMSYMVGVSDDAYEAPEDPRFKEMYRMLDREFPMYNWEEVVRKGIPDISDVITQLPFLVAVKDETQHDIPYDNGMIYYFADEEGREAIRKELVKIWLILETCLI